MLTEEEARLRWCPMARTGKSWGDVSRIGDEETIVAAAVNRGNGIDDPCLCIASGCMAWRWAPKVGDWVREVADFISAGATINAIKAWRYGTGDTLKDAKEAVEAIMAGRRPLPESGEGKGFCGAFGRPA